MEDISSPKTPALESSENNENEELENPTHRKPYFDPFYYIKRLPRLFIWTICTIVLLYFAIQMFQEYMQKIPVTVTTFIDAPPNPDPIQIKICNAAFLDPRKILDYDITTGNLSPHQYNFLLQTVNKNYSFDDSIYVSRSVIKEIFLLSSRTLDEFKLEKEDFMLICRVPFTDVECVSQFVWHIEPYGGCYQADLNIKGYGQYNLISLSFYFDPDLILERYSRGRLGAFVSIRHPQDSSPFTNPIFLGSNELVMVSAQTVHKTQKVSFDDSKCTHRHGLETHDFTGEPFDTTYSITTCIDLCYAEAFFNHCQCSAVIGWNITKTECLEHPENLQCLISELSSGISRIEKAAKPCFDTCLSTCDEKLLETKVSKTQLNPVKQTLLQDLKFLSAFYNQSSLADKLISQIESSADPIEAAYRISRNFADLNVYLEIGQKVKKVETILLMSEGTFISNIGGLMGMWLGLSAVSILEFLEKLALHFCASKKK